MSQIRTRAELERAWLNKKINYQKDKSKVYEYSFRIFFKKRDINIVNFDLNNTDSLKIDDIYLSNMSDNNMSQTGHEDWKTSKAFDVVLMNPFSHDAIKNQGNNTKIEVDWGDGTSSKYNSGEVNFFPFSDVATVYQGDLNNGFKFNDKVDTEIYSGRQSYFTMNGNPYGTYIAQKVVKSKSPRYKRNTNDKHHLVHKYRITEDNRSFKITVRSSELVVPVLVLKKVLYNMIPYKNKIYPEYDEAVPGKQMRNDLEAIKNVVSYYDKVRSFNFLKNTTDGVGKLLTEDGLSRESRHVLMRSTMTVLNTFIPIVYEIDGVFPPALYGNIADESLNTYIKPTKEILDDIKDIYINNKPKIKNVSNIHLYNKIWVKNLIEDFFKNYIGGDADYAEDVSAINRLLREGVKYDYMTPDIWSKIFKLNNPTVSQQPNKTESYHRATRYIDGLKHRGPVELYTDEHYKYGCNKVTYMYSYYRALGEEHRDAFIINERDLDGEVLRNKGISINPFMYLPSREAVNVLTNLAFESEGETGVKYVAPKNYILSTKLHPIQHNGVAIHSKVTSTALDGVIWNEVHNIYMGAFIDKIKVTGIPFYMYKLKKEDWFRNFSSRNNETLEVYIKRLMNSLPDNLINGSKYKQAKEVLMGRGDWFYNNLRVGSPEVKTIQEIVLDIFLKGFISKDDVSELFIEAPLTIVNPFQHVTLIGDDVFSKMTNKDRLDGFFCNMFMGIRNFTSHNVDIPSWTPEVGKAKVMNISSLPKHKIKHMSYIFRLEDCGFKVTHIDPGEYSNESKYAHDIDGGVGGDIFGQIPPSVETVDNVYGFSTLSSTISFQIGYVYDKDLRKYRSIDSRLKHFTNGSLFCNYMSNTNDEHLNILYNYRYIESVDGLCCYGMRFANKYTSIKNICMRSKSPSDWVKLDDNFNVVLNETPDDVVPKPITLSRLIENSMTISDLVITRWAHDNIDEYFNTVDDTPKDSRTLMYEPKRCDKVLQLFQIPEHLRFRFYKVKFKDVHVHKNVTDPTFRPNNRLAVKDVDEYSLKKHHLILQDVMLNRGLIRSEFGLSKENEVENYGLAFMFIDNRYHDTRVRFKSVRYIAEGYLRTYSMFHDESGYLSMHKIDGLILQSYQHAYLDGYTDEVNEDRPYYNEEYPDMPKYVFSKTYDNTTNEIRRCTNLVFGRWNTPMGWMFLSGSLDDPVNANYKEKWVGYGLDGMYTAACDLTDIEGLFYNVGPLATDLYPQMEIHDYDDFINIRGMSGCRFGFCAEKDTNVFVKSDKKYNWKNLFKNDTYYYASATDPLAQATSMDSVEPDLARGLNPKDKYNAQSVDKWTERNLLLGKS